MRNKFPDNKDIALLLEEIADLLEIQKANPHRIERYMRSHIGGGGDSNGFNRPLV